MAISGFTIARNVFRLEYPFRESLYSLLPLCDELVINVGDCDDGTVEFCEAFAREESKVRLVRSEWETRGQVGGQQLKIQTDRALGACRGDWCFYLQADEVLHEQDYPAIQRAIHQANGMPAVDGIVFDYVHFYGNFSYIITGRSWYRREVRAFKAGRGITAFRDAQGFRGPGQRQLRVIRSRSRVFHYGHVRRGESYRRKSEELSQWWGEDPNTNAERLRPRKHVGLRRFCGTHPKVMAERVKDDPLYWDPTQLPMRWDRCEVKNLLTLVWESVVPYRIGEFRNYTIVG